MQVGRQGCSCCLLSSPYIMLGQSVCACLEFIALIAFILQIAGPRDVKTAGHTQATLYLIRHTLGL